MDYLLDTNICIHYFKGLLSLKNKIEKAGFQKLAISEITLAELIYGAEKKKARLKTKGTIISDLDLFIGATAIVNNMVLVTRNIREFERLKDIKIENWIDDQ